MAYTLSNALAVNTYNGAGTNVTVTSPTFTSATGSYYLIPISYNTTGTTLTGVSLAGVSLSAILSAGGTSLWGGYCTSGQTASVVMTFSGTSGATMAYAVDAVAGLDGTTGPLQARSGTLGSTSVTLSPLAQPSNLTYTVDMLQGSLGTITQPFGYVVSCAKGGVGSYGIETAYSNPGTSGAVAWTNSAGGSSYYVYGIELGLPLASFGSAPAVSSLSMLGMGV